MQDSNEVIKVRRIASQTPIEVRLITGIVNHTCSHIKLKSMWSQLSDKEMKQVIQDWQDIARDIYRAD